MLTVKWRSTQLRDRKRKGAVVVLVVLFLVATLGFLAVSIDLGYVVTARAEMQRAADAAAMAACWEMCSKMSAGTSFEDVEDDSIAAAQATTAGNAICSSSSQLLAQDVEFGHVANISSRNSPFDTSDEDDFNAVRVTIRRNSSTNGKVPTFFGRALGLNGVDSAVRATAAFSKTNEGFTTPNDGSNLPLLPFALDLATWEQVRSNSGPDNYSFDPLTGQVTPGSDGIAEGNLYPQDTGASGNRGTVDIGSSNNSTADLARQITSGVSAEDLAHHGGELRVDQSGTLQLNGDPGISAGIKDELASIIGEARMIPIFSNVSGNGNNSQYTIVKFVGVRILNVKLTGSMSSKNVMFQPAPVLVRHGLIPTTGDSATEDIYSPTILVN